MKQLIRYAVCIGVTLLYCCNTGYAQSGKITEAWQTDYDRQFDFWIGEWDVNLRMIQKDLTWKDSVKAQAKIYPILDGKAILELWDSKPIKGFSLRYFDPDEKKWVLYLNWPSNSFSSIGSLSGTFRHGRGQFFTRNKRPDGKESISRYTFCDITDTSLRWDDAFSQDGGKTWTNNWIMEFSRTGREPSWPKSMNAHTFETGNRCKGKEFDLIDSLAGRWTGKLTLQQPSSENKTVDATMNAYRILDGCTIIRFIEFNDGESTYRSFGLISYNKAKNQFEQLRLDNKPGSKAILLNGNADENQISFMADKQLDGQPIKLKHEWKLPSANNDEIQVTTTKSTDGGKTWRPMISGSFKKTD